LVRGLASDSARAGALERFDLRRAKDARMAKATQRSVSGGDAPIRRIRNAKEASGATTMAADPSPPAAASSPARAGLIDFSSERQRHAGFVGRRDVLARIDEWLLTPGQSGWVVVTGGPGMGKSALLSAWLAQREAAGEAVPHHFIRRGQYNWDDPAKLVGSLVAQVDRLFPGAREAEGDEKIHPAARLAAMLERVSAHALASSGARLVIVVDGLDEYDAPTDLRGGDPLAAFLPYRLPPGVSILCATRPRHPYVERLAERDGAFMQLDLDEAEFAADNEATVRAFWEREAHALGLDAQFIAEAVERAAGNLQHAATLRKHLAGLPANRRRVEEIPRGLAALLARAWERIATDVVVVDGLGTLCAAREALTLDEMATVLGWTTVAQRETFVRGARELLAETLRPDETPEYRLHHESIRAHVAAAIGARELRRHHLALAQRHTTWPASKDATARRYALRYALTHRVEAGEWAEAWRIAADMSFLEAKVRELGVHEAEADVAHAAERCRASGDEVLGGRFVDLARAIGRESHLLREAPDATAALVWNRLRQSGWSEDDVDEQLHVSAGASFLRVRHLATRESPALVRDLIGHSSSVTGCAVTPDGRRVVSASQDHTLKVWDFDSGRCLATLQGHADLVSACAVTPDGRRLVSASHDHTLKVWDLDSGRPLAILRGHTEGVSACALTSDGRRVVSASYDQTLKVWDLDSGRTLATLQRHAGRVSACAAPPDGPRAVSASEDHMLKGRDLDIRYIRYTPPALAFAVPPDGRRVVSASWDNTLTVRDFESGRTLATLQGHTGLVAWCAVTPDGRHVVSKSWDKTIKVWDLDSDHTIATLHGHTFGVLACAVTPTGRRAVLESWDKTIKVWDLDSGHTIANLQGHTDRVLACAVTPDGRRLISTSDDRTLKVWDLDSAQALAALQGHTERARACAVTPDGRRVVSASDDKTLKVWDLDSGCSLAALQSHTERVRACAVTPDGRRVVSASDDKTLKVWDLAGCSLATLHGHTERVRACAVTLDGRRVVSASDDRTLKVWDLDSGRSLATLQGHTSGVLACAMTPDGRRVVSASADYTLKVWDLVSGRCLATLQGHTSGVLACVVTSDGRRVVSASHDHTLRAWDLDSGRPLATLQGHTSGVLACAMPPDGQRMVSASADKTLKVWDLESARSLATLQGHTGLVIACAVTSDGRRVVSTSADHTLKVWDLDAYACLFTHRVNTRFTTVTATASAIIAGDATGAVWFLDWPAEKHPALPELADANADKAILPANPGVAIVRADGTSPTHAVFIVHADIPAETAFVRAELLPALQLPPEQVQLSSALPLGETIIGALEKGVASSRITVLVLTPTFLRDKWASFGETLASFAAASGGTLVPLLLADCQLPQRLDLRVQLDCRDPQTRPEGFRRLRELISGARPPAESMSPPSVGSETLLDRDRAKAPPLSSKEASAISDKQGRLAMDPVVAPKVDIGILTIRDDEFRAVLDAFPTKVGIHKGKSREYALRQADAGNSQHYTVAVLRQIEQGNGEAQDAARDLIDDLAPKLLLVIGIAGGLPSDDVKLGDVVLSTRIQDFTISAHKAGQAPTYAATGGPIAKELTAAIANLAAREDELGDWTAALPSQPDVQWTQAGQLYGPAEWQSDLRAKLEHHYGKSAEPRGPVYIAAPIASSDRLVKDPELVIPWLSTNRNLVAVEMESGGVFRAARDRCPMLAIRGISDIVGLKRAETWTKYACVSAAAFARAFLRTRPVDIDGWPIGEKTAPSLSPWKPTQHAIFIGRDTELAAIERAIITAPGARVAVVAVQGMAGVGKSFLVEEFCARYSSTFGVMCRWVMNPNEPESVNAGLLSIAQQAGIDPDRASASTIPSLLQERRVLIHIDNVDGAEAANIAAELLSRLEALPAVVTGRFTALGTTPGSRWSRIEVECLGIERSLELLRGELGAQAPSEPEMRALAAELGGLPLALHLAAGHLRNGFTVAGFLARLRAAGLTLDLADPADPLKHTRTRGVVAVAFQISKELFLAKARRLGEPWEPALSALGWGPLSGFGRSLGTAITGLSPASFEHLVVVATSLSLVRREPTNVRTDGAWSLHPLLAEYLRTGVTRVDYDQRVRDWVIALGRVSNDGTQGARWQDLDVERRAVHTWLASADESAVAETVSHCLMYALGRGPVEPWREAARRSSTYEGPRRLPLAWAWSHLALRSAKYDEVEAAAAILSTEGGERDTAMVIGIKADLLEIQGHHEEALQIRREEQLPELERLGDSQSVVVTLGKIADGLVSQGILGDALHLRLEKELPFYRESGDKRGEAVTLGKISDILDLRGDYAESLKIRIELQLPILAELGAQHERGVALIAVAHIYTATGQIADALQTYNSAIALFDDTGDVLERAAAWDGVAKLRLIEGRLEEALRIHHEERLPAYKQFEHADGVLDTLKDVADIHCRRGEFDIAVDILQKEALPLCERIASPRATAALHEKLADIAASRGKHGEAIRILREEQLPIYKDLRDERSTAATMEKIANVFALQGDLASALGTYRAEVLPTFERLGEMRAKAQVLGSIASLLEARGELRGGCDPDHVRGRTSWRCLAA
jgi:WD40 repeat protein/nucleoside phosphorylase/tetratricopeptide (TPR) repeat protein